MNDRICNKCGASFSTGRCCSNPVIDVSQIQREVHAWSVRNFGMPDDSINPLLGVIEELGEIASALDVDQESWLDVIGYEGRYEVSDYGSIRSLLSKPPNLHGGDASTHGEMVCRMRDDGYLSVGLVDSVGNRGTHFVHTLVAESWIGPRPDGMEVNHKDGDKQNNCVWNLEYLTKADNQRHALSIGLKPVFRGTDNPMARLNWDKVRAIRSAFISGSSITSLCKQYGVSKRTVQFIVNNETWKEPTSLSTYAIQFRPLLKILDGIGRIHHAVLKSRQRIRGFHDVEKRRAAVKDGVGDLLVYLCAFAELENLDLAETLAEVWSQVKQRDWKSGANIPAGHVRVEDDNAGSTVAQD